MKSSLKNTTGLVAALGVVATLGHVADIPSAEAANERAVERAGFRGVPRLRARAGTEVAAQELLAIGNYKAGDKHNHTTCSDGSTSPKVLADQSLVSFGLDWFGMVGHGGAGTRDCRFTDADYSSLIGGPVKNRIAGGDEGALWVDTIGEDAILGDFADTTSRVQDDPDTEERERARAMWRWQSIRDYQYQDVAVAGIQANKVAFEGLEWVVPGHEHGSAAVLDGQFPGDRIGQIGDADAMAQFEYLWDRADGDFSGGKEAGYEDPANNGVVKLPNIAGTEGHEKSVLAIEWLRENHPLTSFAIAAHVERQGGFVSDANRGWNVEHLRDHHNAGKLADHPKSYSLAFGMEAQAGHQAGDTRGTYSNTRPSAGLGTFGGAGAYAGAEVTLPGKDFEGNDLTLEKAVELGLPESEFTSNPIERIVLGRPGVRTMWDALLGEGRRFFHVGSSDWHNRGQFGPFAPQTTLDFWPGEYQKMYSYVQTRRRNDDRKQANRIVEGLRTGNTYTVMGDLIGNDFAFVACYNRSGKCVTMGQELVVREGLGNVTYRIELTDPDSANFSPYFFDNPSLKQIGMDVPMNEPVLHHVDVITGDITGEILPGTPEYTSNVSNPTTKIFATFDEGNWEADGTRRIMEWTVPVAEMSGDHYVRLRGTNIPQGTPFETDADGNPLSDNESGFIPCLEEGPGDEDGFDEFACPDHLFVTDEDDLDGRDPNIRWISNDVEAWAELWFYANPIWVNVLEDPSDEVAAR
ncbi:MAG: hypothetical protein AAF221_10560 [Pseudomonadota bacterium]